EFVPDSFSPDLDRVRPGTVTVEQFAWLPRVALVSGTAGIFFDNRYGASFGVARPLQGGTFLLDAQADLTGFIAFPSTGAEYSSVRHFSGFGGLAWRPPVIDCAVRVRGVRFIDGDRGGEFEVRRAFGDMDIAFFYQRTSGLNASGIRVLFPMAPAVRRHAVTHPPGLPLRVFPVDRIGLDYTDQAGSVGRNLRGVASREDLLRQLNLPSLTANAYRYRAARGWDAQTPPAAEPDRVSLTGMTGFINTPWCGVITERMLEVGYNQIPRGAAYDHRGIHRNDVYYAALGFLPHFEAGVRWTAIPGLHAFTQDIPTSQVTDTDRMLSGRIEILTPKPGRPGLSVGAEDIAGTRRFHSTYIVTGMPFVYRRLAARVSVDYAPRVFSTVDHRTLDGGFGAAEASVWRPLAVAVEYDTEKWNAGLAISGPLGFKARATLLKGGFVSLGGGWSVRL
ncbi:MAG: YjbH domain-containing protein, partial [Candidatus Eisenbacteria bacterium]